MGYETQVEFVGVFVSKRKFEELRRFAEPGSAESGESGPPGPLSRLRAWTNEVGYLAWNLDRSSRNKLTRLCGGDAPVALDRVDWRVVRRVFLELHDESEGHIAIGKWYGLEELVTWLAGFCSGGTVIEYSLEGDGAVRGWQFNRRRERRDLALVPVSRWRK